MCKRINRVLLILLIVILVCSAIGGSVYVYGVLQPQKKRGLIIVPAVLQCGLVDGDTGEAVWDPIDSNDIWIGNFMRHDNTLYAGMILTLLEQPRIAEEIEHLMANGGYGDGKSFINKIASMDEDGNTYDNIQPVDFDTREDRLKFGLFNSLTDIYNYYNKKYGEVYEVSIFHYDFRKDMRQSAEQLEEYINKKGYDEVILVSNATGANIVSLYLAKSQANRDKIMLNISYNGTYEGAMFVLRFLEDKESMDEELTAICDTPFLEKWKQPIVNAYNYQASSLWNSYVIYQMLPTYELFSGQDYYKTYTNVIHKEDGEDTIETTTEWSIGGLVFYHDSLDKNRINSEEALYNFYCSRPWALKSDGTLRKPMVEWLDYVHAMYVTTEDGNTVHATTLVNTCYVAGIDVKTVNTLYYTEDSGKPVMFYKDWSNMGDGSILLGSAVANTTDRDRIYFINGAELFESVTNFNYIGAPISDRIFEDYLPKAEKRYIEWIYKKKIRSNK